MFHQYKKNLARSHCSGPSSSTHVLEYFLYMVWEWLLMGHNLLVQVKAVFE